ncbi:endoglucanase V-like protein [Russula ochroleuca]|uniref:Endoglucanase V-like protein n=1 Tax=Russula ochroleuca TaxID=152965 RepID=A0A9P5MV50_9AGAM|nr:endoglucanase V-like protein [Russula ochroleuca]
MKSALIALVSLSALAVASHGVVHQHRSGGWVQNPSGQASFTEYSGCGTPSCGISMTSGYTAAINELTFGSAQSYGDACGRCFNITPTSDPYTPSYTGPMGNTITVRVSNLCPVAGNEEWCGQTVSHPLNQFNMPVHFDLCEDSGAAAAFFPSGRGAMLGTYQEVLCTEWKGSEGSPLWNGACMAPVNAPLWPSVACGNEGMKHSLDCAVMLMCALRNPAPVSG